MWETAAISSAYVTAYNDYVRRELKFGEGIAFRPNAYAIIGNDWDLAHQPPAPHLDEARGAVKGLF